MAGVSARTLYFFESDGTDNQDWVPTVANIVIGNFTAGNDYCYMDYPFDKDKQFYSGLKITDLANAKSFIIKKGKRGYVVGIRTYCYTKAAADYIDEFFMRNEHVKAADYKDIYLVLVHDAGTYEKFTDHNGTRRDYLQCGLLSPARIRERNQDDDKNMIYNVNLTVKSAFR